MFNESYYIYIITNPTKTVLYTGVTNNLPQRLIEHYLERGKLRTFAGKYNCYNLLYCESYKYVNDAIYRETQIKGWTRKKKVHLIESENPTWRFLNEDIMNWPPDKEALSRKEMQNPPER